MKAPMLLFIIFCTMSIHAQIVMQKTATTQKFAVVCDSVSKLINPNNLILVKNCDDYDAFYLSNDSLHPKGYYIKNLESMMSPPDLVDGKPILAELTVFDADKVYKDLVKRKIYSIKQFSENELEEIYSRPKQKDRKYHTVYGLPHASHDCDMTIIIRGSKNISATYRYVIIISTETNSIEVIKTFYDIKMYLSQLFQ